MKYNVVRKYESTSVLSKVLSYFFFESTKVLSKVLSLSRVPSYCTFVRRYESTFVAFKYCVY